MSPIPNSVEKALELAVRLGLLSPDEARRRQPTDDVNRAAECFGLDPRILQLLVALSEYLDGSSTDRMVEAARQARAQTPPQASPPTDLLLSLQNRLAEIEPPAGTDVDIDLPDYEDIRPFQRGGMGVILRARDRNANREVAIKVLHPDRGGEALRKFLAEGQITAQLEHPNIVPVHQIGISRNGRLFFAMKLVRGRGLDESIAAGEPLSRLLDAFLKVCDAVAFAHARGVLHRDLKPANIMLGEFGEVLVMDWGVARASGRPDHQAGAVTLRFDSRSDSDPLVTLDGTVIGTPHFMPPEQARGRVEEIDERSDIYSLGAILYQIIARALPYEGQRPARIVAKVAEGILIPPSKRREVPRELEAVVLKAMAYRREDRYPTVSALKGEIEAYLEGRVLQAPRYSPAQILGKWIVRHRARLVPLAILALGLLSAGAYFWTRPGRLVLRVTPAGARIRIGDRELTATSSPQEIGITPGRYSIRVESAHHVPAVREGYVGRNETQEVRIDLVRMTGTVTIRTEPEGGRVLLDGTIHGTPLRKLRVPTGPLTVWAEKEGSYRQRLDLRVGENQSIDREVSLPPAVAWRREFADWTGVREIGDTDGDGIADLLCLYGTQLLLFSGASGKTLRILQLALSGDPFGECLDVDGDGVKEWITAVRDAGGTFALTAISPHKETAVWIRRRIPLLTLRETGRGRGETPDYQFTSDLDRDGLADILAIVRGPELRAYSSKTGLELWRHPLPAADCRPTALQDGDLLLRKADWIRRVHGKDGKASWEGRYPGMGDRMFPAGPEEWVYPLPDGLGFLSIRTGKPTRRIKVEPVPPGGSHWMEGSSLFHVSSDGSLRSWDLTGGRYNGRSEFRLDRGSVRIRKGILYARSRDHRSLVAIHAATGRQAWSWPQAVDGFDLRAIGILAWRGEELVCLETPTGIPRWTYRGPGRLTTPPTAVDYDGDGRPEFVFGTAGGRLVCLDATGTERFSALLPAGLIRITPFHLDRDGLQDFLVEDRGGVTAVRARRILWQRRMANVVRATPVLYDVNLDRVPDVILPVATSGAGDAIVALDGRTGAVLWREVFGHDMIRRVGLSGDTILAWATAPAIRLLSARTGRLLRELPAPGHGYAEPVTADLNGDGVPDIFVIAWARNGAYLALDGRTREVLWKGEAGPYTWSGPTIGDVDGDGRPEVYLPTAQGYLLCLDGRTGKERWRQKTGGPIRAAVGLGRFRREGPFVAAVNSLDGNLYLYEAASGRAIRTIAQGGGTKSRPVFVDADWDGRDEILVGTKRGLVCLRESGAELWRTGTSEIQADPVVADLERDGRKAVLVGSWALLHCVDLETGRERWSWRTDSYPPVATSEMEAAVAVADMNGDGTLDIVICGNDKTVTCLSGK